MTPSSDPRFINLICIFCQSLIEIHLGFLYGPRVRVKGQIRSPQNDHERLIYLMLVDGHYRKYLSRLHERLGEARFNVVRTFERIGLELFTAPLDGMFLWARFPHIDDSLALAEEAQRDGIMLAPGTVFRPHLERSPWMRFNVAVCEDTRVQRWVQWQAAHEAA
jgi:DNA-binding transcriptional MocR family regulator